MVRRLQRRDYERLDAFLRERLPYSFPILGDIERPVARRDERELWGWFSRDELGAVLARSPSGACVCGMDEDGDPAVEELARALGGFEELDALHGRMETVAPYAGRARLRAFHRQYMAYLQPQSFEPRYRDGLDVRRARPADAQRIAELWCRSLSAHERERTLRVLEGRLASRADRIYIACAGGVVVSSASTGEESPSLAVIRCTYTDPDLRGEGYAAACLSVLCRDLLGEGKCVVVLTETLADARIYRKVGFAPAGLWAACTR